MKRLLTSFLFATSFVFINASAHADVKIDASYKNPKNQKSFKSLKLKNNMEVLLISDSNFNTSAAALDVHVGSLMDPKNHLGMAHYLEHLLFLGTKTYPIPDSYIQYIEKHQGRWNAFTSGDSTNYHFEINHNGFEGAVKRLSLFFTEPLFNEKFVEKELTAVDSEHKKNIDRDGRRVFQVLKDMIKEDHPFKKFSTGSRDTLKNTNVQDVKDFYEKYYSSNIMKLVLMSPKPLKELEKIAIKYFSPIKNKNLKREVASNDFFEDSQLPKVVKIKPLKDTKTLSLAFELPKSQHLWKSQPVNIISSLLGFEGKGSLFSQLKKEGLATALSSSKWAQTFGTLYFADITLTEIGVEKYERVIELFFSYIKLIKKEGYKTYIFEEEKAISEINYVTREHYEGIWTASSFANAMQRMPAENFERNLYVIQDYQPKEFSKFLSHMTPEKMLAVLTAKSVKTNLKEKYYGTDYAIEKLEKDFVNKLKNIEVQNNLGYPQPNPYISKELTLYSGNSRTPKSVVNKVWGKVYYQFDDQFNIPKSEINLLLLNPMVYSSPKNRILTSLYVKALNKSLEEWKYPLIQAGMGFSISSSTRGIQLGFSGYTDRIPGVMTSVVKKLKDFEISEQAFNDIKEKSKKDIENSYKDDAYVQARYQLQYLLDPNKIHHRRIYDPKNKVDLISSISVKEIKQMAEKAYQKIAFEGVVFGNIKENVIIKSISNIQKILGSQLLPEKDRPVEKWSKIPDSKQLVNVMQSEINNNALFEYVQIPALDYKTQAVLKVGDAVLSADFFTNLRTKQQLGYIVFSGNSKKRKSQGINFIIQSADYDPVTLAERVNKWKKEVPAKFKKLSDKEFKTFKASVVTKLKNHPKNQSEVVGKLYRDYFSDDMSVYNYNERIALEVNKVTKNEVIDLYTKAFSSKGSSMSIHFNKKGVAKKKSDQAIKNVEEFRKKLTQF